MPALVLPVPAALAWQWARGRLSDAELVHRVDLVNPGAEALFITSLFGAAAWRDLARQCRQWPGILAVICRTDHETIVRRIESWGWKRISHELDGRPRWWAGQSATLAFLDTWPKRAGDSIPPDPSKRVLGHFKA